MDITKIKELLGESASEENAAKLVELVETYVKSKVDPLTSELTEAKAEVNRVKTSADLFRAELTESNEAVIADLKVAAQEYADNQRAELMEKAQKYADGIREELTEAAVGYGIYLKEEYENSFSTYSEFVVKEFMNEHAEKFKELNEIARMRTAFGQLREAFEKSGFELSDETALTESNKKIEAAKADYNSLFEELKTVKAEHEKTKQGLIFEEITRSMTDLDKSKVKVLAEKVKFADLQQYKDGVTMLAEQVMKPAASAPAATVVDAPVVDTSVKAPVQTLNESVETPPAAPVKRVDPLMASILGSMGRQKKSS